MSLKTNRRVRPPSGAPKRPLPPALAANVWKPGQSGNPSGHSGEYGVAVRLARALSVRAVERLGELLESDDERVVAVAANAILDRAYGKVRPASERQETVEDRIGGMTRVERDARLRGLVEKAMQTLAMEPYSRTIDTEVEEVREIKTGTEGAEPGSG